MEVSHLRQRFDEALDFLYEELKKIRAGRASADLVEDITIEAYGTKMPLKQLATISVPEPRLLIIQPWDKSTLKDIERALSQAEFHLNPTLDGEVIRIALPPLTEERRKEFVQLVHKYAEEARVRIRQIRGEAMDDIDREEKEGVISEDEKFQQRDKAQEAVNEYNEKIREVAEKKERELLEG